MASNTLIDKLKNYLPLGYALFLFWGLLNEFIYYTAFKINISSYLEVSEILILMYDEVLGIVLSVVLGLIFYAAVDLVSDFAVFIIRLISKKVEKPKPLTPILTVIGWFIILSNWDDPSVLAAIGFTIGITTIIYSLRKEIKFQNVVVLPIILITFVFLFHPLRKKDKLLEKGSSHKVVLKDSALSHLEKSILIGETRNYIFLYHQPDSSTYVINRNRVKTINYR